MKKFIVIIIAVAVVATSVVMSSCCGVCAGEVKFKNYRDSIAEGKGDKVSFAVASIDFPVKGDKTLIKSIRERHNGENRNPWNEMECGSNYARSMAAYSILLARAGEPERCTEAEYFTGRYALISREALFGEYLTQWENKLDRALAGLSAAEDQRHLARREQLVLIRGQLKQMRDDYGNGI